MTRIRIVALLVVVLALGALGWQAFGHGNANNLTAKNAELTVRWRGKYQGTATLPATLNWCPVTRVGVLEAMSGDTGAVLVLYERDSLTAGPHAAVSPELSAATPRPGATFVMRWVRTRPDTAMTGFRSEGGTARIQFAGGTASGDINVRMRAVTTPDTLVMQGVFTKVPVLTTAKGCT